MERRFSWVMALLCLFAAVPLNAHAAGSSQLMVAMRNIPAQADKFRSMMADLNASQFRLVSVQSAMSPGDAAAFRSSMKKNASDIADLRDTLDHTTVTDTNGVVVPLKRVLSAQNVSIGQIVGVYVGGDGQITLFYQ